MGESCIVSVAFRHPYILHSKRQEEVIGSQCDTLFFRDELPMKNCIHTDNIVGEFQKSLYGFKPHAIQRAIDMGYTKVIWFDPSVLPVSPIQVLIDALDEHPMLNISGDATMDRMCNDKALRYFKLTSDDARKTKHVGGTIYGFNFNHIKAAEVFTLWKRAEEWGMFGNQDEFMKGHWADEACMALSLFACDVPQYFPDFKYQNQKEL